MPIIYVKYKQNREDFLNETPIGPIIPHQGVLIRSFHHIRFLFNPGKQHLKGHVGFSEFNKKYQRTAVA